MHIVHVSKLGKIVWSLWACGIYVLRGIGTIVSKVLTCCMNNGYITFLLLIWIGILSITFQPLYELGIVQLFRLFLNFKNS